MYFVDGKRIFFFLSFFIRGRLFPRIYVLLFYCLRVELNELEKSKTEEDTGAEGGVLRWFRNGDLRWIFFASLPPSRALHRLDRRGVNWMYISIYISINLFVFLFHLFLLTQSSQRLKWLFIDMLRLLQWSSWYRGFTGAALRQGDEGHREREREKWRKKNKVCLLDVFWLSSTVLTDRTWFERCHICSVYGHHSVLHI